MLTPLQNRYIFEAEMKDGSLITSGGDITGAVRVSLIPQATRLPRHDLIGLGFRRRFQRGFKRANFGAKQNGKDGETMKQDEYLQVVVTDHCRFYVRHSDGVVLATPPNYELYL